MQPTPFTSGLQYIQRHLFRLLTTLIMVSWSIGLTTYTLHLQHSCDPLLPRSIPESCNPQIAQTPPEGTSWREKWPDHLIPTHLPEIISKVVPQRIRRVINHTTDDLPTPTTTEQPPKSQSPSQPKQSSKTPFNPKQISHHEAMAIVVGSATLIGLAVIEVPIIIATGAGAAIWYAARTIASTAL